MELDELKQAWREVSMELNTQRQLNLTLLRESKLDQTRRGLRPLRWGQPLQIVIGVALAAVAGQFWVRHLGEAHLVAVGLISHVYGLALIVAALRTLRQLYAIDYGAPVVEIQKQVARLEQTYVQNGWLIGLPWWVLWLPISLLVMGLAGVDVYEVAPKGWILYSVAFGVFGALLTVVIFRWAIRSGDARRAARARLLASGEGFARAREYLLEIQRFEQA